MLLEVQPILGDAQHSANTMSKASSLFIPRHLYSLISMRTRNKKKQQAYRENTVRLTPFKDLADHIWCTSALYRPPTAKQATAGDWPPPVILPTFNGTCGCCCCCCRGRLPPEDKLPLAVREESERPGTAAWRCPVTSWAWICKRRSENRVTNICART